MLSEMINEEFIQLKIEVNDWEDAVRQSAKPLIKGGKITEGYVDKIIEIAHDTGPYIVITKHVALPHAPSEFGALGLAMGITTLKKPVVFGNQANDPVKYLFCMSATDSEAHLESMAELVDLLSNESFYHLLDSAASADEILTYIKKIEQGGESNA
ncbi:PTS sugar transporter subunit IIA [Enterococcus sp. BWR-S5]|uniref:PTS sugar transporter subunit IIA n=1 Tax=Enterococcus sp. BWR-S5 TaxID=2787714 RepID=UPI001922DC91|nr:PTS sugar transporter subunit IIA [Enterococcus sp. BWR-S5]MBL1225099.1 PTS sugar transporter subunit IIA [Enterococcus sp. BWR-S5]